MNAFDLLHPGLQHHIVNSFGWRELRPFQEQVILAVLRGEHVLVIAPTAGGKTEAAILPVLSRMLTEDWRGLSTLYICPIKALLNNLQTRLARYASLVGRSFALWHGDVAASKRATISREPPDILLTTPESLEVMLVSRKADTKGLFGQTQVAIIDELHAFAGDDRGWHLLAVLQRVSRLAGRELQKIGLSATIGNPQELLHWLTGKCEQPGQVICSPATKTQSTEVQLDSVGSTENAAVVISRLHRGEKRLVFVDSRARAEQIGAELRGLDVKTFVTHSSLSREQRSQAEQAFAADNDCVIVATSVLELGVDVGDLDRVIQIDSPPTVAGFLQRMGRTGRRPGWTRNCLCLATHDFALLQAAAVLNLWESGYVEDVVPPPVPHHVFAQQVFALVMQEPQFIRHDWHRWIGNVPAFADYGGGLADAIISFALASNLLCEDNGILHMGPEAERRLGHWNFMELLSVITSQPLFHVRYGRSQIGYVHPLSFASHGKRPSVLALAGRSWRIIHLDWSRKVAYVEPSDEPGRSRWVGSSVPLSPIVCAAIKKVLAFNDKDALWSRRGGERLAELREELAEIAGNGTAIVSRQDCHDWWTFAGLAANQTVAALLAPVLGEEIHADNLWIRLPAECAIGTVCEAICAVRDVDQPPISGLVDKAEDLLKFSSLLPPALLNEVVSARIADMAGAHAVLNSAIRILSK